MKRISGLGGARAGQPPPWAPAAGGGGGLGLVAAGAGACPGADPAGEAALVQGQPGSGARELPHEHGAVGGREEAAAGGREAAEVHGVVMAGVVLRVPGRAGLQPQQPVCGEERLRTALGALAVPDHPPAPLPGACPCHDHPSLSFTDLLHL